MTEQEAIARLREAENKFRAGECSYGDILSVTESLNKETGILFIDSIRSEPWWYPDYIPSILPLVETSVNNVYETVRTVIGENGTIERINIANIKEEQIQEDAKMDNNTPNNDAIAARRRALAEALRQGEPVVVTPAGAVETKEEATDSGLSGIQVPDGKLA